MEKFRLEQYEQGMPAAMVHRLTASSQRFTSRPDIVATAICDPKSLAPLPTAAGLRPN